MNSLVATGQIFPADVYILEYVQSLRIWEFLWSLDFQFFLGIILKITDTAFLCSHSQPELSFGWPLLMGASVCECPTVPSIPIVLSLVCSAYLPVLLGSCRWLSLCSLLSVQADLWTKSQESWVLSLELPLSTSGILASLSMSSFHHIPALHINLCQREFCAKVHACPGVESSHPHPWQMGPEWVL